MRIKLQKLLILLIGIAILSSVSYLVYSLCTGTVCSFSSSSCSSVANGCTNQCNGTANCASIIASAPCTGMGCSWGAGNCAGTVSCPYYSNQSQYCLARNCSWANSSSFYCYGTPNVCQAYTVNTNCTGHGCSWGALGSCTGTANACSTFNETNGKSYLCKSIYGCTQVKANCSNSSYITQDTCEGVGICSGFAGCELYNDSVSDCTYNYCTFTSKNYTWRVYNCTGTVATCNWFYNWHTLSNTSCIGSGCTFSSGGSSCWNTGSACLLFNNTQANCTGGGCLYNYSGNCSGSPTCNAMNQSYCNITTGCSYSANICTGSPSQACTLFYENGDSNCYTCSTRGCTSSTTCGAGYSSCVGTATACSSRACSACVGGCSQAANCSNKLYFLNSSGTPIMSVNLDGELVTRGSIIVDPNPASYVPGLEFDSLYYPGTLVKLLYSNGNLYTLASSGGYYCDCSPGTDQTTCLTTLYCNWIIDPVTLSNQGTLTAYSGNINMVINKTVVAYIDGIGTIYTKGAITTNGTP